jgi:hypothetical protein
MVKFKHYVAGWLGGSIHEFIGGLPGTTGSAKHALITCLDSNQKPSTLLHTSRELRPIAKGLKELGDGLLVPTRLLIEATLLHRVFFGFDEVYFFPTTNIEPKPDSASLVGPAKIEQRKIDRLGDWMSRNDCSLALGDGEGINYIVKARGLVKYLLGFSIARPPSTTTIVAVQPGELAG